MFRKKFIDRLRDKYKTGGVPATLQNMPRPNIPMPNNSNQGVIKPTDDSLRNKMYQASQQFKNLNIGPGGTPVDSDGETMKNPVTSMLGSFSGATPVMEIAQSNKNFKDDPTMENAKKLAIDAVGTIPLGGKILGVGAKYGPKVLSYADDALNAFKAIPAVSSGLKALKGYKLSGAFTNETGGFYQTGGEINATSSDTIQGLSKSQRGAQIKFERNIQKEGLNPFSNSVKSNTQILKDKDGNFIYRYITPPTDKKQFGGTSSNTLPSAMLPGRAGTGLGSNTNSSAEALTLQRLQEQAMMKQQQEAMANLNAIVNQGGSGSNKRQMGGPVDLPGGSMEPIPGSDAVEFKGQTHDEGGIMMDAQTEVEDGETMDQVTMAKKGGKRDYFFSSYLKKGGTSFADMHKQILQMGGSQEDVDALAKEQEKVAGRNPGTVKAKHGGARVLNKVSEELEKASKMHKAQSVKIADLVDHMGKKQGGGFFGGPTNLTTLEQDRKDTPMYDGQGNPYLVPTAADNLYMEPFNQAAEEERQRNITNDMLNNPGEYGLNDDMDINEEEENVEDPFVEVYRAQQKQKQELMDKARKKAEKGKGTPTEAYIGMGAQALPALYAFLHKQKPPQEVSFTKGFSGDVRAGRIKAQKLDRVNYNAERSAADADKRSFDRFVETSGGGPANVINRLAMHSKNLRAKMAITAAETKANTAIGNQEAAMAQQAETQNVANALRASQFNAQMNRAEAARQDQVEAINVAAKNKFQEDQELNKMNALIASSSGIAGAMGDILTYKSGERMAKAIGSEGIYQRDIMRNYVARQAQKNGIPDVCEAGTCTDEQLNAFVADIKF